ncbi:hypothetical protein HGP28_12855 [Vibrio sp. SM6]|uniref:Lipoprotein n=1 Tax=Vibrio agarilyticus TaxID=2726741 RepID=A0A7X8YHR5_9VIBR|nr:hypothetical protein [Vibrio agarilyticus]NLS13781.1 hypothetical protein [Vibrio agarilyticus]
MTRFDCSLFHLNGFQRTANHGQLRRSILTLGAFTLCLLTLSGCGSRYFVQPQSQGTAIHLVPIEHVWSVQLTTQNAQLMKEQLLARIEDNIDLVATHGVTISANSASLSNAVAQSLAGTLTARGIEVIKLIDPAQPAKSLMVKVNYAEVVTEHCRPAKAEQFSVKKVGCYADNARWQSMINPQLMVDKTAME